MNDSDAGSVVAFIGKYHGLGNRLRVALGALSLARATGRSFRYTWPTGRRFGAELTDLWRFDERRISAARSRLLSLKHPYRDHTLDWMDGAARERVWQIRTPHALRLPPTAEPWAAHLQRLELVSPLRERVLALHAQNLRGRPYVGVMVRTHAVSNAQTLEHSPVEWYISRMQEIATNRDVSFFVSADTHEAQQKIQDAVPSTFAQQDKGGYNTRKALESSVVDLYLLAGAGHLLGPHYSSFPEVAQQLAGPGLRLETSRSDAGTRLLASEGLDVVRDPLRPFERDAS
ncbi:O-fucosyltransferase family protein [Microbacterium sp. GXF0217]